MSGHVSVSTGIVQVSTAPAIFEPYVFMINGLNDVYYKVRNTNGSWSGWSPVGIGVGAAAISAITFGQPTSCLDAKRSRQHLHEW